MALTWTFSGILPHRNPISWYPWLREYKYKGKWRSIQEIIELGLAHRMTGWDYERYQVAQRLNELILKNPNLYDCIAGDM
jgi:hypothetical protein